MRSPLRRLALVFLWVLLSVVQSQTGAEPLSPAVSGQNRPVFYVSQVWPWGYAQTENGGTPGGVLADFARSLAELSGVPLHIELRPHRRVIAELADGKSGFVTLFEADEPPGSGIDLGTVTTTEIVLVNDLYAGTRQKAQPLSLNTLSGKSIAFINGTSYGPGFDGNPSITRVPVRDLFQAVDLLKMDRVDGFISSDQAFYHTLDAMSLTAADFTISRTGRKRVAHLYMDHMAPWSAAAKKLKAALEIMRESGELAEIFALPLQKHVNNKD